MPKQVKLIQLSDISNDESPNEIFLDTHLNIQLHIVSQEDKTIISFPIGNKFDIVDGRIIIHKKR